MARKIQKSLSKEQKRLLIALLIGDGTISSNYVFKLSHSIEQYVKQVPSLLYKIRKSLTKEEFIAQQKADSKRETSSDR